METENVVCGENVPATIPLSWDLREKFDTEEATRGQRSITGGWVWTGIGEDEMDGRAYTKSLELHGLSKSFVQYVSESSCRMGTVRPVWPKDARTERAKLDRYSELGDCYWKGGEGWAVWGELVGGSRRTHRTRGREGNQWSAHLADPTSLTSLMIYVELQAPWLIVN